MSLEPVSLEPVSQDAEPLDFVLYRSRSCGVVTDRFVLDILARSLRNNARDGLTGFLHSEQDFFVQYVEGPAAGIASLMTRIRSDLRHRDVTVLAEGETDHRLFPDWDMGLLDAESLPRSEAMGYGAWVRALEGLPPQALLQALVAQGGQLRAVTFSELA